MHSEDKIREGRAAELELRQTKAARDALRARLIESMINLPMEDDLRRARLAIAIQSLDGLVTIIQSVVDSGKIEEASIDSLL